MARIGLHKHIQTCTKGHILRGRRGRDRIVAGFTTTYVISVNQQWCCEYEYFSYILAVSLWWLPYF